MIQIQQSWALVHPSLQVLSFLGPQVSLYIVILSTQVLKWVRNWVRRFIFLSARPALKYRLRQLKPDTQNFNGKETFKKKV